MTDCHQLHSSLRRRKGQSSIEKSVAEYKLSLSKIKENKNKRATNPTIRRATRSVEVIEKLWKTIIKKRGEVSRVDDGARTRVHCRITKQERFLLLFHYILLPLILHHCFQLYRKNICLVSTSTFNTIYL